MKKTLLTIISIIFVLPGLKSQNLFSNPDFELYSSCPLDQNEVDKATGWISIIASPDYMNCSYNCWTGQAIVGAQSGTGYMGFASYDPPYQATEAIAQHLSAPLIPGNTYNIFLQAKKTTGPSYADSCGGVCFYGWTVNPFTSGAAVGICPEDSGGTLLGCTDSVLNTQWQPYVATFVAPAAYDFIGIAVACPFNNCGEYIFIDNLNFVISSVSENQTGLSGIKVFQGADNAYLNVSFNLLKKVNVRFSLISVLGKTVSVNEKNFFSGPASERLPVGKLAGGIYFLRIVADNVQCVNKVLVKN